MNIFKLNIARQSHTGMIFTKDHFVMSDERAKEIAQAHATAKFPLEWKQFDATKQGAQADHCWYTIDEVKVEE